jgi:arylsulfatase A-like enzyme
VLLVADDLRHDTLGVAGNPVVRTPHLDELAASGVRFTQAYVTTSICMTSRASILTGQYMSRHGIDRFGMPLTPEQFAQTYTATLRGAGYWSGFVGKYGVGDARPGDFDYLRAYQGQHWTGEGDARLHVTERNARDAIAFLQERPADRPFVLSVSFFAPHAEDQAPEQYLPQDWSAALYEGATVPRSPLMDEAYLQALPPFLSDPRNEGRIRFHWRFETPDRFQRSLIDYYRLVTEVDEAVGRLVGELKAQGVYDDTIVLFVGDNGYFHAERGLADKWYPYEESIRVPLVVADPRLPAAARGGTRDEMVLNLDLAPTMVAAAGLPVPGGMQGEDLAPLYLASSPPAWRDEFFYEHPTITDRHRIPSSEAVIRRDAKYVAWPEWDHEQLFDLRADPTERQSLVEDPAHAALLAQMRGRLAEWRERAR